MSHFKPSKMYVYVWSIFWWKLSGVEEWYEAVETEAEGFAFCMFKLATAALNMASVVLFLQYADLVWYLQKVNKLMAIKPVRINEVSLLHITDTYGICAYVTSDTAT